MIDRRKYTEGEQKKLLDSMVILVDTREKQNSHILDYFDKHKIEHKKMALPAGDYSFMLPKNEDLGIDHDMYFYNDEVIERKRSLDELEQNFAKERERFNNEFSRMRAERRYLLIENATYGDVLTGNYGKYSTADDKHKFKPQSFLGSLHSFNAKYNLEIVFMPEPQLSPVFILGTFRYYLRYLLK